MLKNKGEQNCSPFQKKVKIIFGAYYFDCLHKLFGLENGSYCTCLIGRLAPSKGNGYDKLWYLAAFTVTSTSVLRIIKHTLTSNYYITD